jgi:hypothetical protein
MSCRPHQMDEQIDCPGSSTRRGNSAASTASRMRASRRAYLPAAAMTGSPVARGGASPHRPTRCANLTPRTDWNAGLLAAVCSSLGGGRSARWGWGSPGYRTRLPPPRRINAAIVGVKVGGCYRRADTSSRDKPQPTQTVPAPLHWSPRNHRGCQGKRRHDPVGAVGWRRLAAMCRL